MITQFTTNNFASVTGQAQPGRYVSPSISMSRPSVSASPLGDVVPSQMRAAAELPPFARITENDSEQNHSKFVASERPSVAPPCQTLWSAVAEGRTSQRYVSRDLGETHPARIIQMNGHSVTGEDVQQILRGIVSPGDETEAGRFLRALWLAADGGERTIWSGLPAAVFLATGDHLTVRRLLSPIEVLAERGREILPTRAIAKCLRWTIDSLIQAGRIEAVGATGCVDTAFMRLNQAMHEGAIFPRSGAGPVNRENAHGVMFAAAQVTALLPRSAPTEELGE